MEPNPLIEQIPRLRRYARELTGDRYAVDNLVHSTLERALKKLRLWRPGSGTRAWLFSIMHNILVNQRRSPRTGVEHGLGEMPDPAVQATQFDRVVLAEVEKALHGISAEQREVLLLIAVEQMSYEETANALAIPIGTVMSRLSRARERLRQLTVGASRI